MFWLMRASEAANSFSSEIASIGFSSSSTVIMTFLPSYFSRELSFVRTVFPCIIPVVANISHLQSRIIARFSIFWSDNQSCGFVGRIQSKPHRHRQCFFKNSPTSSSIKKHTNSQRTYPDTQFHLRDCRWKTCSDFPFNTGIPKATAEFSSPYRTRCRPPRCTSLEHPLSACVFCFFRRLQKCISCR